MQKITFGQNSGVKTVVGVELEILMYLIPGHPLLELCLYAQQNPDE